MSSALSHRVSLLLNVVLAITAVAVFLQKSKPASEASARSTSPTAKKTATPGFNPSRAVDTKSETARRLSIIDRLRAMGVPDQILVQAVRADFEVNWEKRFAEESLNADPDKSAAMQLEHDMAKDTEMRAALGEEAFRQWDQKHMLQEAMSGKVNVTAAETDAIYDLKKKLQRRQFELEKARVAGTMDETESDVANDKIFSEFNQEMKTLLGDARYATSQGLDEGSAAANLRQDLGKVSPSDSQLKTLVKVQQQWSERRSALDKQFQDDQGAGTYVEQIRALEAERDQLYRQVLGANVFDAVQKQQDSAYTTMKKYENLWGLDDSKIDYVYGTLKYYEKSVEDYKAQNLARAAKGESVDWDAVNETLQEFSNQTQQSLQQRLGKDDFGNLQRNSVIQLNQAQSPRNKP